jgi:hypothetical protein
MIEPVYVPYEQYRAAKTRCGLDSRIYGISVTMLGHKLQIQWIPHLMALHLRFSLLTLHFSYPKSRNSMSNFRHISFLSPLVTIETVKEGSSVFGNIAKSLLK